MNKILILVTIMLLSYFNIFSVSVIKNRTNSRIRIKIMGRNSTLNVLLKPHEKLPIKFTHTAPHEVRLEGLKESILVAMLYLGTSNITIAKDYLKCSEIAFDLNSLDHIADHAERRFHPEILVNWPAFW